VDVRIIGGGLPVFAAVALVSVLEKSVSMLAVRRGAKKFRVGTSLGLVSAVGRLPLSLQFRRSPVSFAAYACVPP
jgi:hypothetical protein